MFSAFTLLVSYILILRYSDILYSNDLILLRYYGKGVKYEIDVFENPKLFNKCTYVLSKSFRSSPLKLFNADSVVFNTGFARQTV